MRIRVNVPGKVRLWLPIPNVLLFNRSVIKLARLAVKKSGEDGETIKILDSLSKLKFGRLRWTARKMRLLHPGLSLVEVETSDGVKVNIKL